ncbi:MAG: methyltransferase domain-containing protein [Deltaproteobacteria bacterium]|nr:methyltransferase domain-containing protein [Deltaproteobacteria bacterium]MBW2152308.1 methyltransferase domain-containing protein [Deltaproteobacteria bacterium]
MSDRIDRIRKAWGQRNFSEELAFQEEVIIDRLVQEAKRSRRILEIGVGNGRMISILRSRGVKTDFIGIDINNYIRNAGVQGVIADCIYLPFQSESFDLVYSLGVVEHFPETAAAIREHARVLKSGGTVLVMTPHLGLATVIKWFQYLYHSQYRLGSFQAVRGRNLTIGFMRRCFEAAGIEIIACRGAGVRQNTSRVKRLVKAVLPNRWLHPHLYCLGYKCGLVGESAISTENSSPYDNPNDV